MKNKLLLGFATAMLFAGTAMNAQVVVRVRPPRPLVERRPVAPGAGYVWTHGYHRYEGNNYVWTPGAWVAPPRPGVRWRERRWVRRHGEYVLTGGEWR